MRNRLLAACVLVFAACGCGGGGASPAPSTPAAALAIPPAYTTWALANSSDLRMPPLTGDRLTVAVARDGSLGFASPFVHGTYTDGTFAWSETGPLGGGPVSYGRGADGLLYGSLWFLEQNHGLVLVHAMPSPSG